MSNEKQEFPRRNRIDLLSPAEKAIYDAQQAVERAGADPRLTKATILLSEAGEAVADYIDSALSSKEVSDKREQWVITQMKMTGKSREEIEEIGNQFNPNIWLKGLQISLVGSNLTPASVEQPKQEQREIMYESLYLYKKDGKWLSHPSKKEYKVIEEPEQPSEGQIHLIRGVDSGMIFGAFADLVDAEKYRDGGGKTYIDTISVIYRKGSGPSVDGELLADALDLLRRQNNANEFDGHGPVQEIRELIARAEGGSESKVEA